MCRRGENIYRRKDGRWEGRYPIGREVTGKLKYRSIYGHSYQEVKQRLYPLRVKFTSVIDTKGNCTTPFYHWSLLWLDHIQVKIKRSTYSSYRYKLEKYILPYIGEQSLNQLTLGQLQDLVNTWEKANHSVTTIHLHFQIIKRCLEYAVRKGFLVSNPSYEVTLPKKQKQPIHSLNKREQKCLEQVARLEPNYKGLPILISLQAGLRIGEISALKWENIDLKNGIMKIEQTYQRIQLFQGESRKTQLILQDAKTASSKRKIPLTNELIKRLKEKKRKSESSFVFSTNSHPCEPRLLSYHFQRLIKKAKLTKKHFHQLRHTFATRCLERNHDISSISALLGHASTQMTLDIYADSLMEQREAVIHSLEI